MWLPVSPHKAPWVGNEGQKGHILLRNGSCGWFSAILMGIDLTVRMVGKKRKENPDVCGYLNPLYYRRHNWKRNLQGK